MRQPVGGLPGLRQMAYAVLTSGPIIDCMPDALPVLPSDAESIAELRELYRASEARAARLRLLSVSARELAQADSVSLDALLERCAQRLAFFVGCRDGAVHQSPECPHKNGAIAIHAPGEAKVPIAWMVIEGLVGLEDIPDAEDRDAFRMELDLLGSTIDRIRKDQERTQLVLELQSREQTLGKLLDQIFTAQEEERRRVSHELHDGVAQTATALVRILESPEGGAGQTSSAMKPADVARSLVAELRRVIAGLRPTLLDDLGLEPALQSLFDSLKADGFDVSQTLLQNDQRLPSLIETAVFRVAQEAVANIRKHAGGPCAVRVYAQFDTDPLILRIEDQGVGPSEGTIVDGAWSGKNIGIEVMKERMSLIGGNLTWGAGKDCGVFVEARFPATM